MKILYPSSPLSKRKPDEKYLDEVNAVKGRGFSCELFSLEDLQAGEFKPAEPLGENEVFLYRGWMLSGKEYDCLEKGIRASNSRLFTSFDFYLASHHLVNWYPMIRDFTPETVFLSVDADLESELSKLGWSGFFVKDYVKSLKTSIGSIITDPEQISNVAAEMKKYRGTIEGGYCIRKIESYEPGTETRYFLINGIPYANAGMIPQIVEECAKRLPSNFFSVDVAKNSNSQLRVVEIGDGQVSDLVGWEVERFAEVLDLAFSSSPA